MFYVAIILSQMAREVETLKLRKPCLQKETWLIIYLIFSTLRKAALFMNPQQAENCVHSYAFLIENYLLGYILDG